MGGVSRQTLTCSHMFSSAVLSYEYITQEYVGKLSKTNQIMPQTSCKSSRGEKGQHKKTQSKTTTATARRTTTSQTGGHRPVQQSTSIFTYRKKTTVKIRSKRKTHQLNHDRPNLGQPEMGVSHQPPMLLLS